MSDYAVHTGSLISFSHAGVSFDGLTKDAAVSLEVNEPVTTVERGLSGRDRAISVMGDRSGTVTIQVLKQSPLNTYLANLAEQARQGNVINAPINVSGDNGNVFFYKMRDCIITEQSGTEVSADLVGSSNTWTFDCNELQPITADELNLSLSVQTKITDDLDVAAQFSLNVTL